MQLEQLLRKLNYISYINIYEEASFIKSELNYTYFTHLFHVTASNRVKTYSKLKDLLEILLKTLFDVIKAFKVIIFRVIIFLTKLIYI